jgi:hypothetical protein
VSALAAAAPAAPAQAAGRSAAAAGEHGWPLRTKLGPVPLPPKFVRFAAVFLTVLGCVLIVAGPINHWQDWSVIWAAGANAGSRDLVDAARHADWQTAHGILQSFFKYPPATAYLFWPLAQLPLDVSYWVQAALMLGCIVASGRLAASIFGLSPSVGILAALAWAPNTSSVATGQNAPFALFLALVAIWALKEDRPWVAGLAVGLMLYKPTMALPLMALFLIRGRWRELAVTLVAAGVVYLLSVAAAGGDWNWLALWLDGARTSLPADAAYNIDKHITLPGLVGRLPVPWIVTVAAGGAVVLAALPGLRRAGIVEAAAAACLLGLAAGPRAWGYEAALAFPFVCWVLAGGVAEPWRTRLIAAAYLLGPSWMVSLYIGVNGIALVVLGGSLYWIWRWWPSWLGRGGARGGRAGATEQAEALTS